MPLTICLSLKNAKVEKGHDSHKSDDLLPRPNNLNKFQDLAQLVIAISCWQDKNVKL